MPSHQRIGKVNGILYIIYFDGNKSISRLTDQTSSCQTSLITIIPTHLCSNSLSLLVCMSICASVCTDERLPVPISSSKHHTFLSCFLWCAQRGVILNPPPGQTRHDLETFKLKNSKVPLCPPLPNPQVALQAQPGTKTVPPGLKRPLKPQARQARPLKLKLTRGALTTLVAGLVSSTSLNWSHFACRCPYLPASLHGKRACITVWRKRSYKVVCMTLCKNSLVYF